MNPDDDDSPPEDPPPPTLGSSVNLFPTSALQNALDKTPQTNPTNTAQSNTANTAQSNATNKQTLRVPGWVGGHDLTIPGPFDFTPPKPAPPDEAQEACRTWFGPTYEGLAFPPEDHPTTFQDQISAEAALSLLPSALIGALAKPAVDYIYKLIDYIPTALRRPFEKAFGLLIDNAMAAVNAVTTPLVNQTTNKFFAGGGLPPSANIPIRAYSQTEYSCGETAAATILKWSGEPVSVTDVETQIPFVTGTSGLVDEEFTRRGLSIVSGPGNLDKLKAFLASNYPVMISIGWESGGGHLCVVSGYDDQNKTVTIVNYDAQGGVYQVPYDKFQVEWGNHLNYMTAVVPLRDSRLDELRQAGDLRRPTPIYEGLTLSDFYVNQQSQVFVEAAYRYVTDWTDITVRVSFDQSESSLERQVGGSLAVRQKLATGWILGMTVEKVSLRGQDDNWSSFTTAPLALYGSLQGPGFELRAGYQKGGFQASLVADLSRFWAGMGLQVDFSVDQTSGYRVFCSLTGTF